MIAHHSVEDADVAAGAHRDEQVCIARDRRHARIEHDELRAVIARLPEIVGSDRCALGDIRARDKNHLRFRECRSMDWRCDRCRKSSSTRPPPTPCRAGRCSRCSLCARPPVRTCPSGRPSRSSATHRSRWRKHRCRRLAWIRWISLAATVERCVPVRSVGSPCLRLAAAATSSDPDARPACSASRPLGRAFPC